MNLPASHEQYTDKYFLRTNQILKAEGINPEIEMKVFARGEGPVVGIEDAIEVLRAYSDLEQNKGEVWATTKQSYQGNEPLMIIKGQAQDFVELETMYLGVLSDGLSAAIGYERPTPENVKSKVSRLSEIYGETPILYFGARHYHWSLDQEIAQAAIEGGATQTSTDIGSSYIGKEGVGTTPHLLSIILGAEYGKDEATLMTAKLFDEHIDSAVPRVTLVDTFNREITDALAVAAYFGPRSQAYRVDTCGENIGEGGSVYPGGKDPNYQIGTGVTLELLGNLRNALDTQGYDHADIFLSSGFGNEEKARIFSDANTAFREANGRYLYSGVGIGEVTEAKFATADIYKVNGTYFSKTGREVSNMDFSNMKQVL